MNHGGSKEKPLLTELAVRKNVDEISHRFTYRNYICSTFFCTSSAKKSQAQPGGKIQI
jgi:hypothetical protein